MKYSWFLIFFLTFGCNGDSKVNQNIDAQVPNNHSLQNGSGSSATTPGAKVPEKYHHLNDSTKAWGDKPHLSASNRKLLDSAPAKKSINIKLKPVHLIDLKEVMPSARMDLRYATENNFVNKVLYDCAKCYLHTKVVGKLKKAQERLQQEQPGYAFKIFDCYRPLPVQERLWEIMPNADYVTPPQKGSMHNRGLAVDITILDEKGIALDMGTEFDFFGEKAHYDYTNLEKEVLENRKLLRGILEEQGFRGIRTEWWHFSISVPGTPIAKWEWDCI